MTKYNYELLKEFCKINDIELVGDYTNISNRDTIILGKCKNKDCLKTFEKNFRTLEKNNSFYCEEHLNLITINKHIKYDYNWLLSKINFSV